MISSAFPLCFVMYSFYYIIIIIQSLSIHNQLIFIRKYRTELHCDYKKYIALKFRQK